MGFADERRKLLVRLGAVLEDFNDFLEGLVLPNHRVDAVKAVGLLQADDTNVDMCGSDISNSICSGEMSCLHQSGLGSRSVSRQGLTTHHCRQIPGFYNTDHTNKQPLSASLQFQLQHFNYFSFCMYNINTLTTFIYQLNEKWE
ncbi:hypothetical protein SKAU_G00196740 [Synaphobranchus kaupii]|uniref:Uncharacterized protein n=1 Tax=Synaphobranchus kaupii TaxID=118154 RepID=A0A9Q1FEM8_SYNKA|nr:hypothetical protein SKAU_G00196740 [Synaphobranchus kaupii]